jgi:hypothetical protein
VSKDELALDECVKRLRRFLRNVGGAPIAAPLRIVLDELERLRALR